MRNRAGYKCLKAFSRSEEIHTISQIFHLHYMSWGFHYQILYCFLECMQGGGALDTIAGSTCIAAARGQQTHDNVFDHSCCDDTAYVVRSSSGNAEFPMWMHNRIWHCLQHQFCSPELGKYIWCNAGCSCSASKPDKLPSAIYSGLHQAVNNGRVQLTCTTLSLPKLCCCLYCFAVAVIAFDTNMKRRLAIKSFSSSAGPTHI